MKPLLEPALAGVTDSASAHQLLQRCLQAVRSHLGMEVAFISEFRDGRRHFRQVDGEALIAVGGSDALEDSYCQRVVDGRLPELIADAGQLAEARKLPATGLLPVGAHLSVPIRLQDGEVYGTFCCFSRHPDTSLNERDLKTMRVFAELIGQTLARDFETRRQQTRAVERIEALRSQGAMSMVYQPICEVATGTIVGFEALARFHALPQRGPDQWFAEAARVGRDVELELQAIAAALEPLERFPASTYLSVNASPATLTSPELAELLAARPLHRIVVEVTEHAAVDSYDALVAAMRPLQRRGLRLAIDDAGAGYASFRHVLNLAPHQIKLDTSLTHDIHRDRSRYALATALCSFARATGCGIVAEGIECDAELQALRELGVGRAQGYHLGHPSPLEASLRLAAQRSSWLH